MKNRKILPCIFGALGAVLAAAALLVCLTRREAEPVMARYPQEAEECAGALLEALCSGDFQQASQYLYGTPTLGSGLEEDGEAAGQLWASFASSLRCTPEGRCYATAAGLAQDVNVSSLDMGQVLQTMKATAPQLLEQRVAQAQSMDEIYDDNHEYREEFLREVMRSAASAALEGAEMMEHSLTLQLLYQDHRWWVLPDQALLDAVSGGILE